LKLLLDEDVQSKLSIRALAQAGHQVSSVGALGRHGANEIMTASRR